MINLKRWREKENCSPKESNVIQYDDMGYPLRLVIDSNGKQYWRDTYEREDDVVLKWNEVNKEGAGDAEE